MFLLLLPSIPLRRWRVPVCFPSRPAAGIVDTTLRDGGLLTRLPPADLDHLLALLPHLPLAAVEVGTPSASAAAADRFAAACRSLTAASVDAAAAAAAPTPPPPPTLVALSPPAPAAIRATAAALTPFAPSTRLHTYLPAPLAPSAAPCAATRSRVTAAVAAARDAGACDVAFTVAAATAAPAGVVVGMAAAAAAAGATVVGVADTGGVATPSAFGRLIAAVVAAVGVGAGEAQRPTRSRHSRRVAVAHLWSDRALFCVSRPTKRTRASRCMHR